MWSEEAKEESERETLLCCYLPLLHIHQCLKAQRLRDGASNCPHEVVVHVLQFPCQSLPVPTRLRGFHVSHHMINLGESVVCKKADVKAFFGLRQDLLHVKSALFALDAQIVGAFSAGDFPIVHGLRIP